MGASTRFQTSVSILIGAVFLVGGAVAVYSAIPAAMLQATYESAPPCASLTPALTGSSCRLTGTATIVQVNDDNSVAFKLAGVPDRTFGARFRISADNYVQPGVTPQQTVSVEFWSGRVTRLAGEATVDNPEQSGNWQSLVTIGAVCVVLGLALLVWAIRRRRETDVAPSEPSMAPVAASQLFINR